MPFTFNGIGTMYYGKKNHDEYLSVCEECRYSGHLATYETKHFFVILFIPIIPLGWKKIMDMCPRCKTHKVLPLEEWKTIETKLASGELQIDTDALGGANIPEPGSAEAAIETHIAYVEQEMKDLAESLALEMTEKFPSHAELQHYLGTYYRRSYKDAESVRCFERVLLLEPDNEEYRKLVGVYYLENDDLPKAAKLLAFMRKPGPNQEPEILSKLARKYFELGDHHTAYSYYEILARDCPYLLTADPMVRKGIKKVEKQLHKTESILPPHEHALALKVIAALTLIAVALFFLLR
ncbi:MAG: hypothetical protein GY765_35930 [bacterium]|nr:hypothetical protein [bacterium]